MLCDNIGLVSKQCQFEDVAIIHCTNASLIPVFSPWHPYSTIVLNQTIFYLLVINVSGYDKEFGFAPSSDSISITQKRKKHK